MIGTLTINDLTALCSILHFYEKYLLNTVAPSVKRGRLVIEVQLLIVKVSLLPQATALILTTQDVDHIDNALSMFLSHVRQKIPQSKNRDGILECCENLRQYMMAAFAPD